MITDFQKEVNTECIMLEYMLSSTVKLLREETSAGLDIR